MLNAENHIGSEDHTGEEGVEAPSSSPVWTPQRVDTDIQNHLKYLTDLTEVSYSD